MKQPLTQPEFDALRRLSASLMAGAIESFHERLNNEGFMDGSVRCLSPQLPTMLGYAATIKIRGAAPPVAGSAYSYRTDWWDYLVSLPEPRILVVQDFSSKPGLGSLLGAVHFNILRALNCVGVVTNGAVRDLPIAADAALSVFAGNVALSHSYVHIIGFGNPVEVGGLRVQSGDLLHGDMHGVQNVPLDIAALIPPVAAKIADRQEALIALCRSPGFSLEKLREAMDAGRF